MDFKLRGETLSITPSDILTATRDARPAPIDGRHKYFVELQGRRFPIKQVLRLVTGPREFGAQDAHRILSRLGFDVSEYESLIRDAGLTREESLELAIGR